MLNEVSLLRLYILRAYYALMALGTIAVFWPDLISHSPDWGIESGAQYALLGAITPLALLVMPWRYFWQNYVVASANRWR